ncbi:MAG TPA: hypothetical protein H9671_12125 [Firmicutes bacterium]|nr:hypothetical protein [Bacillota bacterium]
MNQLTILTQALLTASDKNEMLLAWELMGYGIAGIFAVLLVFYLVIRLISVFCKEKNNREDQ